ncbi:tetratricopeptide repeat protein [Azospirillum doebereinerae]
MATYEQALALAIQHHRAGRLLEAKELYRRLIDTGVRNPSPFHLLGQAERHSGRPEEAVARFRQALAMEPDLDEVRVMLADALDDADRPEEAIATLRQALGLAPSSLKALHRLGTLLCTHGGGDRLPEATALLNRAVALDPSRPESFHDLAVALSRAERLEEALLNEERALVLQPDFAAAHMARGTFLNEIGDRDLARASQRMAVALMPAGPELYYNLGNTLHSRGELDAALGSYRRAVQIGLPIARLRVAAVLIQLGRLDEAEAELLQAPGIPGADVSASLDLLADLLCRQGRLEEGKTLFARIGEQPAANGGRYRGECMIGTASLLLHEGRAHEAAQLLARVSGDSSRLFTVKSVAVFRVTLAVMGATLERPANPAPDRPRIGSSSLASHGRFAHNALEYIMLRLYAEKHGYVLETPEWVGGYYFDINDPLPSGPLSPLYFPRRIINGLLTGRSTRPPVANCDILSPLFLFEHHEEYRARVQSWLKPRPLWSPFIAPVVERLRALGDTVVAIHIRRGDFVTFKYPITETAWYVDWLRSIWSGLKRPVLYLASDDLDGVRADFAEFRPVTRADLADPWPGLEYLQDFNVLANADVVGISAASGYSLLAARLNTTARLCVEPDMAARRVRPFAPWTAPGKP